jgi:hypothetical protein
VDPASHTSQLIHDVPVWIQKLEPAAISIALITTEIVCKRCREHCPDIEAAAENDWNTYLSGGRIVGFLCPDCQTADEVAEAEVNAATTIRILLRACRILLCVRVIHEDLCLGERVSV